MRTAIASAVVVLLIGSLGASDPSVAKVATQIDLFEIACLESPGMTWVTGDEEKVLHLRGQVSLSVLYDVETLEVVGGNTIVGNADLNQATGKGSFCGTFSTVYLPASETGTFDGRWTLNINSGGFSGRAVGQGTGDLRGRILRVRVQGLSEADAASLLQQLVGLGRLYCPPSSITGILRDVGVILPPG